MRSMADLITLMAKAIRSADNSYFSEDYSKQATAVLKALGSAGYEVVPKQASEKFLEYAQENMPFGRMKPEDFVREFYGLLVANARRLEK